MRYIAYMDHSTRIVPDITRIVEAFKALSDRKRVRIMRTLYSAQTPLCIPELVDILMEPQYAISRAIATLRRAGLVEEFRRAKVMYVEPTAFASTLSLNTIVLGMEAGERLSLDSDRLRWRLSIRNGDGCNITYPRGYNPEEYGFQQSAGTESAIRTKSGPEDSPGNLTRKARILFVCVHNSARSQLAEEYLRREAGDLFEVESAGLEPGLINPYVTRILAEDGIDISAKQTRSVFDVYREGHTYAYVITVCSREAEEKCPIFPGPVRRINWPFPDPGAFTGSDQEILENTRAVARSVQQAISRFVEDYRSNPDQTKGVRK